MSETQEGGRLPQEEKMVDDFFEKEEDVDEADWPLLDHEFAVDKELKQKLAERVKKLQIDGNIMSVDVFFKNNFGDLIDLNQSEPKAGDYLIASQSSFTGRSQDKGIYLVQASKDEFTNEVLTYKRVKIGSLPEELVFIPRISSINGRNEYICTNELANQIYELSQNIYTAQRKLHDLIDRELYPESDEEPRE